MNSEITIAQIDNERSVSWCVKSTQKIASCRRDRIGLSGLSVLLEKKSSVSDVLRPLIRSPLVLGPSDH